jgi:hypothetical protein
MSPRPAIPIGFRASGAASITCTSSSSAATTAQPSAAPSNSKSTGHQPREGSRPVGITNRVASIIPNPAIQNHSLNHVTQVSAAPVPRCSQLDVRARPIASQSPTTRNSQPTALAGRKATMTAPRIAQRPMSTSTETGNSTP